MNKKQVVAINFEEGSSEDSLMSTESFHQQENICYKLFCLMLVVLANLSNSWARTCIVAMFGFGEEIYPPENAPYYYMSK